MVETQTDCRLKVLRSDNGTEYSSNEFLKYLATNGILRQTSATYSPEQNGVAETANRTIVEAARSMLYEKKIRWNFGPRQPQQQFI